MRPVEVIAWGDMPGSKPNPQTVHNRPEPRRFVRRNLTWAGTFEKPSHRFMVQVVEYLTGKRTALRLVREFERRPAPVGHAFWAEVLDVLGIGIETPQAQISRIPENGPVIVVANHPTGPLDGIIIAEIIGRIRQDYRILTRDLMTMMETDIGQFLIPVPFWHQENAQKEGLKMRASAMTHLASGGVLALFPSGIVASSKGWFGPAEEEKWNVFTAKLIRQSKAIVVPVRFLNSATRACQLANKTSPILRQGMLIHEIMHCRNKPQAPVIGHPLLPDELQRWNNDPRGFMSWLRNHTLHLEG